MAVKHKRGRNWYVPVKNDPDEMLRKALPSRVRWQAWVYLFDGAHYRMVPGVSPKCNVRNAREFRRMVAAVEAVLTEGAWRDDRQSAPERPSSREEETIDDPLV